MENDTVLREWVMEALQLTDTISISASMYDFDQYFIPFYRCTVMNEDVIVILSTMCNHPYSVFEPSI